MAVIFVKVLLLIINLALLVFLCSFLVKVGRERLDKKRLDREYQAKIDAIERKRDTMQFTGYFFALHDFGLTLEQGAECVIYLCPDAFFFESGEDISLLEFSDIADIDFMTKEVVIKPDPEEEDVSAISKILGDDDNIAHMVVKSYLVFTKFKDGQKTYYSFDVSESVDEASEVVKSFFSNHNHMPANGVGGDAQ